ncbi:expansin EXLX1 family cellulose-binding protein [Streptomyces aurantiogriseus]|uniref:Expansin-like EG45 domain-containing protein n=1 Tax=Streptomyces aurantiogriseus TaxID=66870 RepID=A0A918CEN1_9ACTN|nr:expansin EXLX1 family cellulose-binding protein [Streptomyces aurantiogriseus]GGR19284.1 hypothetical protein GCM10010251_39340 [Streptomyces aurantiogriseus]
MASSSHRRSPRRRPTVLVSTVAVAAVALVVSLVVAFRPDREASDGPGAATPVAGRQVSVPSGAPEPRPSSASPTATAATTTPSAAVSTPSAPATSEAARPSAPSAARTPSAPRAEDAGGSLAGRIRPAVDYQGVATSYDAGNGDGACSYGPSDDLMVAAMNTADYETSKACGAYVRVRAAGGASVTVRIVNECPAPCEPGQLDLSTQAFAKLAPLSAGRIPITWSLVSPSTSDTISIRYKTGSSRYWCGIQAIGHRNPLARLEVRTSSGWTRLPRTEYNYFLSEQGSGCGGAIRITDIYGERLTVDGIALRPDAVQPTRVQFSGH